MNDIKILKVTGDRRGCTVLFPNAPTQPVAISLHTEADSGMEFIRDHNLEVAWLVDCDTTAIDGVDVEEGDDFAWGNESDSDNIDPMDDESVLKTFIFSVEYEHKGRVRGWDLTESRVNARTFEQAVERVQKRFKTIYEFSFINWQYAK